jgi:hypothetical protein
VTNATQIRQAVEQVDGATTHYARDDGRRARMMITRRAASSVAAAFPSRTLPATDGRSAR